MRELSHDEGGYAVSEWLYNGYDCCVTLEVHEKLQSILPDWAKATYEFSLAASGPALEMTLRGFCVDQVERTRQIIRLTQECQRLREIFEEFCIAAFDHPYSISSPHQLKHVFFTALRVPEFRVQTQGEWKVSTNREAMEKLCNYYQAEPFARVVLAWRDAAKLLSIISTGLDDDGRFRAAFNVAGTKTSRWSSNNSAFGSGGNLQNIPDEVRRMFIADPGYKLCNIDLEQADARGVAAYAYACSGLDNLWRACESGDLHTTVSSLLWPHIRTKADAQAKYYRDFSYRDLAKRGGHGTNYLAKARTVARHLKIPVAVAEDFQDKYFAAFPEIPMWHQETITNLQLTHRLTNLLGRVRIFLSRLDEDKTHRDAIAHLPQSLTGDYLMTGAIAAWRSSLPIQWLCQVHDSIVFQYPEEHEAATLQAVSKSLIIEIPVRDKTLVIPHEISVGWNWGKRSEDGGVVTNPLGMQKYRGSDARVRQALSSASVLDLPMYSLSSNRTNVRGV